MHSTTSDLLLLLLAATTAFLLHVPPTDAKSRYDKLVVVTNNHTNFLSVRCFSFDNAFDVVHLPSWGQYKFKVKIRPIYPSATMFNCSTNMGTFVSFKSSYECSDKKYETCDWRFDEDGAYLWDPEVQQWISYFYSPNYESLERGGVIQGVYAN